MNILGLLFIFFIILLITGLSIIGAVLRTIFGFGRRSGSKSTNSNNKTYGNRGYRQQTYSSSYDEEETTDTTQHSGHKKIFTKDDGEYVDFEEIKEDNQS